MFFRLKRGRDVKVDGPFKSEHHLHCFLRTYLPGCQRCHLRMNAPVHGLAWYVACCCVLFERWYKDIEKLQIHQRSLVTTDGVASPTTALLAGSRQLVIFGSFSAPSNGVASTSFAFRHFDSSFISALTGFVVAHAHNHLPIPVPLHSYNVFIVCLMGHTAVRTFVS